MDINELTIGQAKELSKMFGGNSSESLGNQLISKYVIIRTYSAGVWFGVLLEKSGNEVILKDARRMWKWHTIKSISLSSVAKYGINREKSKICPAVDSVWLEAIEILPCTLDAIDSIGGAQDVEAS